MEIITILFLAFAVIAFGLMPFITEHKVTDGYIVGKEHHPIRAIQEYDSFIHRKVLHYIPERYVIYVADTNGVNEVVVTESEFEMLTEGAKFQREKK